MRELKFLMDFGETNRLSNPRKHKRVSKRKRPLFLKERPLKILVETGESRTPRPEERYPESLQAYTAVCSRSTVIRRPISVEPADVS